MRGPLRRYVGTAVDVRPYRSEPLPGLAAGAVGACALSPGAVRLRAGVDHDPVPHASVGQRDLADRFGAHDVRPPAVLPRPVPIPATQPVGGPRRICGQTEKFDEVGGGDLDLVSDPDHRRREAVGADQLVGDGATDAEDLGRGHDVDNGRKGAHLGGSHRHALLCAAKLPEPRGAPPESRPLDAPGSAPTRLPLTPAFLPPTRSDTDGDCVWRAPNLYPALPSGTGCTSCRCASELLSRSRSLGPVASRRDHRTTRSALIA